MKVLLISFYFPKTTLPESIQTGRIVKFLSQEGILVDVVTVERNRVSKEKYIGQMFNYNNNVNITYTQDNRLTNNRYLNKLISLFPINQFISDNCFWWKKIAIETAEELLLNNSYDLMYTRAQPFTSNLTGLYIKKKYGIKWAAHFSDPWVDSPIRNKFITLPSLNSFLERQIFKYADFITVPSEKMKQHYDSKYSNYSKKIFILEHMYDLDAIKYIHHDKTMKKKVIISHIGSFYKNRSPHKLLEIIGHVKKYIDDTIDESVEVKFIGNHRNYAHELHQHNIEKMMYSIGRVDYCESLEYMNEADALIFIDTNFDDSKKNMFLPSKLADYAMFKKPIVCIADKDSISYKLIKEMPGSLCIENNESVDIAADRFYRFIQLLKYNDVMNNYEITNIFEGRKLIKKFIDTTLESDK